MYRIPLCCFFIPLTLLIACKDERSAEKTEPEYKPHISAELVHPLFKGIVVGVSTKADLVKTFPDVREGEGKYNDKPMTWYKVKLSASPNYDVNQPLPEPSIREITFCVVDELVVGAQLTVVRHGEPEICPWVEQTIGAVKEATQCAGTNASFGKGKYGPEYCIGSPDGKSAILVECGARSIEVNLQEKLSYYIAGEKLSMSIIW